MADSGSSGGDSGVGVASGGSLGVANAGIGMRGIGEPTGLPSPLKTIDLGQFLSQKPVQYDVKRKRVSYDSAGPLEANYARPSYGGQMAGLYTTSIRPVRDSSLYKESSFYRRGFSRVMNSEGSSENSFGFPYARRRHFSTAA